MAPFKLKFRMGSSRSTSQEHDPDPQVNEALLNHHHQNHHSTAIGASSSTIDSADCTSLGSVGTNERKSLLPPHKSNTLRLGYLNPNIAQGSTSGSSSGTANAAVPQTPPPSYEHVLEENTRLANTFDLCSPQRPRANNVTAGPTADDRLPQSRQNSGNNLSSSGSSIHLSTLDGLSPCTDPDCIENFANEQQQQQHQFAVVQTAASAHRRIAGNSNARNNNSNNNKSYNNNITNNNEQFRHHLQRQNEIENDQTLQDFDLRCEIVAADDGRRQEAAEQVQDNNDDVLEDNDGDGEGAINRKESIDSTELLISTNMTTTTTPSSQENLLDNCGAECREQAQCCGCSEGYNRNDGDEDDDNQCSGVNTSCGTGNEAFCDPLINHSGYHSNDNQHCSNPGQCRECSRTSLHGCTCTERRSDSDSDDGGGGSGSGGWNNPQMSSAYQPRQQGRHQQQQQQQHQQQYHYQQLQHHQQQQQQQQEHYYSQQEQRSQTPEIISNKSSKEIYKDLAKQWGITCKMSDGCRCMECQGHYFDCEYDDNEHQKSDGGLGAGTPMFISEVMHGTACTIL